MSSFVRLTTNQLIKSWLICVCFCLSKKFAIFWILRSWDHQISAYQLSHCRKQRALRRVRAGGRAGCNKSLTPWQFGPTFHAFPTCQLHNHLSLFCPWTLSVTAEWISGTTQQICTIPLCSSAARDEEEIRDGVERVEEEPGGEAPGVSVPVDRARRGHPGARPGAHLPRPSPTNSSLLPHFPILLRVCSPILLLPSIIRCDCSSWLLRWYMNLFGVDPEGLEFSGCRFVRVWCGISVWMYPYKKKFMGFRRKSRTRTCRRWRTRSTSTSRSKASPQVCGERTPVSSFIFRSARRITLFAQTIEDYSYEDHKISAYYLALVVLQMPWGLANTYYRVIPTIIEIWDWI